MFIEFEFNSKLRKRCFTQKYMHYEYMMKKAKSAFKLRDIEVLLYYFDSESRRRVILSSQDIGSMVDAVKNKQNYVRVYLAPARQTISDNQNNTHLIQSYYLNKLKEKFLTIESTEETKYVSALQKIQNNMVKRGIDQLTAKKLTDELSTQFKYNLIESLLDCEMKKIKENGYLVQKMKGLNISISTIKSSLGNTDTSQISFEKSHFLLKNAEVNRSVSRKGKQRKSHCAKHNDSTLNCNENFDSLSAVSRKDKGCGQEHQKNVIPNMN